MSDYFIRCKQGDTAALRALGSALGLIAQQDGDWRGVPPHGYSELGTLYRVTGQSGVNSEGLPIQTLAPILAPDGKPYWHANLRFAGPSLFEHAKAVAAANPSPELEAAVQPANFGRFFVIDPATGEATRPDYPTVVFA